MVQAAAKESPTTVLHEFFFLRHAARLDQLDFNWRQSSTTPYDTPITSAGVKQAKLAGQAIAQHSAFVPTDAKVPASPRTPRKAKRSFVIHSSPFLRCIQTSLALASMLHAASETRPMLRLDCFLGEWMTPDYFTDIPAPPSMPDMATHARHYLKQLSRSPPSSPPDEAAFRQFQSLHMGTTDKLPTRSEEAVVELDSVQVDWKWDSSRLGVGGELGEQWPEMHQRFRRSLRELLNHYSRDDCTEQDPVVILVTHAAGCNAMIGAVTSRPVLMDVGLASMSHAILRDPKPPHKTNDAKHKKISDEYCLLMSASTIHLQVPESANQYGGNIGRSGSWHSNLSRSSSLSMSSSRGLWSSPKHSRLPSTEVSSVDQLLTSINTTPSTIPIQSSTSLSTTRIEESPRERVVRRGRQRSFTIQNCGSSSFDAANGMTPYFEPSIHYRATTPNDDDNDDHKATNLE